MGTVYEAEQDRPRRKVALKVIRPGLASPQLLRRFELEAQVLGRLQHPGIAHIYEAGMADAGYGPQPFFAMELVPGRPLTEFAEAEQLGTRERLKLMARVCDAVQHAHQKGVIHRDLKPGNILVDGQGQPKILDFGVARATDADLAVTTLQTDIGQLVGTIPYMSPEQIEADPSQLDTRSDVYALGVITYELLAGRLPGYLYGRPVRTRQFCRPMIRSFALARSWSRIRLSWASSVGALTPMASANSARASSAWSFSTGMASCVSTIRLLRTTWANPPSMKYRRIPSSVSTRNSPAPSLHSKGARSRRMPTWPS